MAADSRRAFLAALLVVAAFAVGFGLHAFLYGAPLKSQPAPSAPAGLDGLQSAFTRVAEQVRPAVVNVGTVTLAKRGRPPAPGPFGDDPLFKDFFEQFFGPGAGPRGEFKQPSLGSGFIIDKRGDVVDRKSTRLNSSHHSSRMPSSA